MAVIKMEDVDLLDKRVLIREDLNVPIKDGEVTSDARIRAAVPGINMALEAGARVIVMSHLGRPEEGVPADKQKEFSLAPVAKRLETLLDRPVRLVTDWWQGVDAQKNEVVLLENVRFNAGEKANDQALAKQLAELCDIFVMDAFGTAHRAQASTEGVARYAPIACAGPLLSRELEALEQALAKPQRPLLAIVGGSKVSTKLAVLEQLAELVDRLIVGGGIANTFLAASGKPVGKSLYEPDLLDVARRLMEKTDIPLPVDVVVATEFSAGAQAQIKAADQIGDTEMVLDIGPQSAQQLAKLIGEAKTIIWNGPVGVFEYDQFGEGTRVLAQAIAASDAFSIAGGGDTLAAIEKYGIESQVSYISTGGGAFLEYVEGKKLPAVAVLEERAG